MNLRRSAVRTTGTVVSYHESSHEGVTRYRPRVRYTTLRGDINTVAGQMDYTSPRIPVGTEVPVDYQEVDTTKMRMATFFDNWLGASVAAVVGLLTFLGGFFVRRQLRHAPAA